MGKNAYFEKDYTKLGLTREISLFEDGLRTTGVKGEYEWWYFDVKLQGGGSLVVVFHTGPIASFKAGFTPWVSFDLTLPNGEDIHTEFYAKDENYSFSKEKCDVRIGECSIVGDLKNYMLHYKDDKVEADISLNASVPSWRPYTGHIFFKGNDYFAWLPSVPEGQVKVTIKTQNGTTMYEGTGYHDHNWGNKPMFFLMHHWYWGRAKIGDYVIVSSFITADKKCAYTELPIFMIAKDGQILADDAYRCLRYTETDYEMDPLTKKHVAKTIVYDYKDGDTRYKITYYKNENIERMGMETQVNALQYVALWVMGLRGSYRRMGGTAVLERFEKDELKERVEAPAIWEQMYFGKDRIRKN